MLLLLDHHDSFTYNLAQYFEELGAGVRVVASDAITLQEIVALSPAHLVLSPGPGAPDGARIFIEAARALSGTLPILGVCLGHQAIARAFGANVIRAREVRHGMPSPIEHDGTGVFEGVANPFEAGRYHSLSVERSSLPDELIVTAWTKDGEVMGLRHRRHPTAGVQFHPESILTPSGKQILRNFIHLANLGFPERTRI